MASPVYEQISNGTSENYLIIRGMKDPNCIFCKIVSGDISAEKVYEDGNILSFLDINPVNEGHILLIPKEHYPSMSLSTDEVVAQIFTKAKSFIEPLREATNSDFIALTVVGTDVPHFHVHLIPRSLHDGLAGFWPAKKYENAERMRTVATEIRNKLNN